MVYMVRWINSIVVKLIINKFVTSLIYLLTAYGVRDFLDDPSVSGSLALVRLIRPRRA
jgi:hypothetical protein